MASNHKLLDRYRNANKLKLYVVNASSNSDTLRNPSFTCYTQGDLSYYLESNTASLFDNAKGFFGSKMKWFVAGAQDAFAMSDNDVLQSISEVAFNIDIKRKYMYLGSNPLIFDIKGLLINENSYYEDIYKPIIELSKLIIPTRATVLKLSGGETLSISNGDVNVTTSDGKTAGVIDWASSHIEKLKKEEKKNGGFFYSILNGLKDGIQEVLGGDVYLINKPESYQPRTSIAMVLGPHYFTDVIVKKVTLNYGPSIYDESGVTVGGMQDVTKLFPAYATVGIRIQTTRMATVDMLETLNSPAV